MHQSKDARRALTLVFTSSPPVQKALNTLRARADRHPFPARGWPAYLLQRAGWNPIEGEDLPLGALGALGAGLAAREGFWLCAEPVHLHADQDQLYLAARAEGLAIDADEASALIGELNALFEQDGWAFFAPHPERWYLRAKQPLRLKTRSPDDLLGCSLWQAAPQGADAMQLQAKLSEMQMLLHASAANRRRRQQGRPLINSLWLWGGATLPVLTPPWRQVQADDDFVRGLARLAGARCIDANEAADCWTEGGLLVLGGPRAEAYGALFSRLLAALKSGRLDELAIVDAAGHALYTLNRRAARRWWRRAAPVS